MAATEVPERPALAPNVQLVGELRDTGFKDRQWLVQRDGQFIQLTELLYRIAEQATGERTLEEIAARVTDSTNWMVSADNVRQLLHSKLIPLGLVTPSGGSTLPRGEMADAGRPRSPLTLNMRTKMVGPRVIDPIARVLQVLYVPPILIFVLTTAVIAHGWLYLVHGVSGSIRDVLYNPGLFLIVLAITLASAVFHEFGHASALRYGNGKVRGMGAGIYLIYPVFYTDVTDSYRLGRWARVRTGLGGIYFHLIFALGLMALYLVSKQEFLLLVVLLLNLDIVRQFLPFVRLDGYWVLADLTGIPDFFSQMGPFLRTVLPLSDEGRSKLPNLKPWVKAVFAAYIILAIPVLTFLLGLLIVRLPMLIEIIWNSFLNQARVFSSAWVNGDFLSMTASGAQTLLLGLQALGIAYLLYGLGRWLAAAVRRLAGAARHPRRENL